MAGTRGAGAARRGRVGTRGGIGRIVAMAIGLALVLLLAVAGEARGGLYRVVQCGWGVGAELDPAYPLTEGNGFALNSNACVPPPGPAAAGMRLEAAVAPDGTFGLARARWPAPAGAVFRGARLTWSVDAQWGNWQALGFDVGDTFRLLVPNTRSFEPTPVDLAVDGQAWAFEAWLQCIYTGSTIPCSRSIPSTMRLRDLVFTLEDQQAPQVELGGTLAAGGWRRGTSALELGATDAGAGIAAEVAWIDGSAVLADSPACATRLVEGELRGTKMQPCPATATRSVEVDTARLADGPHVVGACANDFSGAQGCAPEAEIAIDNSPPSLSFTAATNGEVAAAVGDRWSGPAAGTIAFRRTDADAWTDLATDLDREGDGTAILSARLPDLAAGTYLFRATATDAAGNTASAQLRVAGSVAELRHQAAEGHGQKGTSGSGGSPARRRRRTYLTVQLVTAGRGGARDRAGRPGRSAGSGLTVDYGTAVEIRGRLADTAGGIPRRPVAVVVRPAAGIGAPDRRRVLTDGGGNFALRLPAGTSRHLTVAFHGGGGFAPASPRSLTLRVRAGLTLTAEPTELHTGDSVHLRGRVRLGPAHVSGRGKLVAIQYLERATGRWRPALVVRTDAKGRFDTGYRFRYVTGVARIRLRATAPAEGGWPFARGSSPPVTVTVTGPRLVAARGR
jgi:hypothetical protein